MGDAGPVPVPERAPDRAMRALLSIEKSLKKCGWDNLTMVQDLISDLRKQMDEVDRILKNAGLAVHKWRCSKEEGETVKLGKMDGNLASDEVELEKVLGMINLLPIRSKEQTGSPMSKEMLLTSPPTTITRRQYYSNVQALFSPAGILVPILLRGKILSGKSCNLPGEDLD